MRIWSWQFARSANFTRTICSVRIRSDIAHIDQLTYNGHCKDRNIRLTLSGRIRKKICVSTLRPTQNGWHLVDTCLIVFSMEIHSLKFVPMTYCLFRQWLSAALAISHCLNLWDDPTQSRKYAGLGISMPICLHIANCERTIPVDFSNENVQITQHDKGDKALPKTYGDPIQPLMYAELGINVLIRLRIATTGEPLWETLWSFKWKYLDNTMWHIWRDRFH